MGLVVGSDHELDKRLHTKLFQVHVCLASDSGEWAEPAPMRSFAKVTHLSSLPLQHLNYVILRHESRARALAL